MLCEVFEFRDDEGKLEVIYKNRWEGILGVVLGLGDGRASRRRRAEKLVSYELHVSQASAAGISRRLGRDESSECLTYELMHFWRSRGDKMRLE